jgi:DNA-binding NarL/FixJ family response regulator
MILIACNDPKLVDRWSRALREKYPLYSVNQKTALLRAMSSLKPRLLIVDVGLPRLRTVRELPAIQQLSPLTKVVVISDRPTTSEGVSSRGNTPGRLLGDPPVAPTESTRKG